MGCGGSGQLTAAVKDEQMQQQRLPSIGEGQQTRPILVHSLLVEEEIQHIKSLSAEVSRRNQKIHCMRSGWSTRYLHVDGLFQRKAPALLQKLINAAVAADAGPAGWKLLSQTHKRGRLNPRVIEHHSVTPGGALSDKDHFDQGSLVTIDVMLSRPDEDFDGGRFCTSEGVAEHEAHHFSKGDALIFVSHKYHFVQPVVRGKREVLVIELWEGRAPHCDHRCGVNFGRCAFEDSRRHERVDMG